MNRKSLSIDKFSLKTCEVWANQWFVLTAGDFATKQFNAMTVAWGSFGCMWHKPFAQVVVRPTRHTFGFMNEYPSFTLCAFPEQYRGALQLIGTKSGRDGDKIKMAGLTPIASSAIEAPCFAEAELVMECKKMYWQDIDPSHFADNAIENNYPKKDYHRSFFGEIVALHGTADYEAKD